MTTLSDADTTCLVYAGLSVDGFIARADGAIDWLTVPEFAGASVGIDFGAFMASIDALVMGRRTFDTVRDMRPWPYGDAPVVVLSHRELELSPGQGGVVELEAGDPAEVVARQAAKGRLRLYVDGGATVAAFLAADLIDELVLTTVPVLIGDGIRLFGALPGDRRLELVDVAHGPPGFVQTRYRVRLP
jgi:dihydrofolate reductase